MDQDRVFKALADPSRRVLLDALHEHDGQSVGELCAVLPEMTRFGAMKHLSLLEQAQLIVTERVGRSKQHYLNPVPIQQIADRWISKYASMSVNALTGLTDIVESRHNQEATS